MRCCQQGRHLGGAGGGHLPLPLNLKNVDLFCIFAHNIYFILYFTPLRKSVNPPPEKNEMTSLVVIGHICAILGSRAIKPDTHSIVHFCHNQ